VFAVGAEEFGIVLCLMLLALFAFIVIRSLRHAQRNEDRSPARRLGPCDPVRAAIAINMAVNLHLMPAKA